ncbi:MAG: hypothetical protein FWC06_08995 [Treponema sp.]|nr:hypothetical protein [Treponema sp.]
MAKLALYFRENESIEDRNLTAFEINEVTTAALGAHAIIKVMTDYANNNPQGKADDTMGIYGGVFSVLDWLMEPIRDYLFSYAGREAEPEKE